MNGAPAKPIRGTAAGSSATSARTVSATNAAFSSGAGQRSASTAAAPRTGCSSTGPGSKRSPSPMPPSGVMMSLNRIAASSSNRRTGWSVTSTASSGVRIMVRKSCRSRRARYSGR